MRACQLESPRNSGLAQQLCRVRQLCRENLRTADRLGLTGVEPEG